MAPVEQYRTRADAIEAALAEMKRCMLARIFVCARVVGGTGRINVTEIVGKKKLVKRFRWTSGETA